MAAVPFAEAKRRAVARRQREQMRAAIQSAFGDVAMLDHSALVVWTRGQLNGIRATLKRLGMGC